jgi:hypothetical protein
MTYKKKCAVTTLIVDIGILLICSLLAVFASKYDLNYLVPFCFCLAFILMGVYLVFGKYVYFRGEVLTKRKRLINGIIIILFPILAIIFAVIFR